MKLTLIAAGSDLGVDKDGAKDGALKLIEPWKNRKELTCRTLEAAVAKEYDKDNMAKNLSAVNDFNTKLYKIETEELQKERFPITLGGDHTIAIASSLAIANHFGDIGMIWIDSHGDFNTFETTLTGNLHGLPLACLTGYHNIELRPFHDGGCINPKHTVIVGARDLDPMEIENLKDAKVTIFTTEDIQQYGVNAIMEKAFSIANQAKNGVYVSYDLDVIDPTIAPGVSVKAKDGINKQEALDIANNIMNHREIIRSLDIVEFNPLRDEKDKTYTLALEILTYFITHLNQ